MIKADILMVVTSPDLPGIPPEEIAKRITEELEQFKNQTMRKYAGVIISYSYEIRGNIRS